MLSRSITLPLLLLLPPTLLLLLLPLVLLIVLPLEPPTCSLSQFGTVCMPLLPAAAGPCLCTFASSDSGSSSRSARTHSSTNWFALRSIRLGPACLPNPALPAPPVEPLCPTRADGMLTLIAADAPAALVPLLLALPAVPAAAAAAAGGCRCMAVLPFAAVEVPRKAGLGLLPSPLSAPMLRSAAAVIASWFRAALAAVGLQLPLWGKAGSAATATVASCASTSAGQVYGQSLSGLLSK